MSGGPAASYTPGVIRTSLERRLNDASARLKQARAELAIADEQLAQLADEADDARLRSLVSETPLAERDHREASRHATAMERHRSGLRTRIAELERLQDELLDRLAARNRA
jgi:chromosome segregation ATPase